jgi:hypothetical protein
MTRHEFFEWLDTCPTMRHCTLDDRSGCVIISFPTDEQETYI